MASRRDLNEMCKVLHQTLNCELCKNPLKAGKTRWYQCENRHQNCPEGKEFEVKETCSFGKSILKDHCPINEKLLKAKTMRLKCSSET